MFKITRTSTEPIDALLIYMNRGSVAGFEATAATAEGPTFSEVVDAETAAVFREDAGLARHFSIEDLDAPAALTDETPRSSPRSVRRPSDTPAD